MLNLMNTLVLISSIAIVAVFGDRYATLACAVGMSF